MPLIPRATRWLKMADDARRMVGRTRDPEGKRIMLEIARSYDDLAAWAEKIDAIPKDEQQFQIDWRVMFSPTISMCVGGLGA
jgi:hypothetical protein